MSKTVMRFFSGTEERLLLDTDVYERGSALLERCKTGDLDYIKWHLDTIPSDCNFQDKDLRSPGHSAATNGQFRVLQELSRRRANLFLRDKDNNLPLHDANRFQHKKSIKVLQDDHFVGKLRHAAENGNITFLKKTLGKDKELLTLKDPQERTLLHLASAKGQTKVVVYLLEMLSELGYDDNARDVDGQLARELAPPKTKYAFENFYYGAQAKAIKLASNGYTDELRQHLNLFPRCALKADFDARSLIHFAADNGNLPTVRMLVEEFGASITVKDQWGRTPEESASNLGRNAVVAYLQRVSPRREEYSPKLGSDVPSGRVDKENQEDQDRGYGFLRDIQDDVDTDTLVEHLTLFPNLVEFADFDRRTALMLASCKGNLPLVKALVEKGANISLIDDVGNTAIMEARRNGHINVEDYLQTRINGNGGSFLRLVAEGDILRIRDHLKLHPEDIAYSDYDQRNAMHIACKGNDKALVHFLVKQHGDLKLKDRWGQLPIDEALKRNNVDVLEFLKTL